MTMRQAEARRREQEEAAHGGAMPR